MYCNFVLHRNDGIQNMEIYMTNGQVFPRLNITTGQTKRFRFESLCLTIFRF